MRNKLLLYLFIFTLLFTIFIYVNDKKILDSRDAEIENLQLRVNELEAKTAMTSPQDNEAYFSLMGNEDAMTYFENKGIEADEVASQIEHELMGQNKAGANNPFVPFEGMEGNMRINKIKILNHKWLILDFTDGKYWGEVFFTYFIENDGSITFNAEKSFLYNNN